MERNPRSVDEIVEQQVRLWQLRRKAQESREQAVHPVVTVSRQFGARGAAVANVVAQRLGVPCWDRELLTAIARHADAPASLYAAVDEHRKELIKERIAVLGPGRRATADDYHARLIEVLHTIASHGHAVVVGRGAEFVLDPRTTLRVRVVCPLDERVHRLAERERLDAIAAADRIAAADADRRDFVREHYARDVDDPAGYDLIVSTSRLSIERAADIIVHAYEVRFATRWT